MMSQDSIKDPEHSLHIIAEAIAGSKENIKQNAWYFIFWGALLACCCTLHYLLFRIQYNPMPHILWPLGFSLGAFLTFIRSRNEDSESSYSSYSEIFTKNLWIGLGAGFLILMVMMVHFQQNPVMPLLLLSGIGTMVTGLSIRFLPMSLGGVVLLIGCLFTLWIPSEEELVLGAICGILGQVVPGILLSKAN